MQNSLSCVDPTTSFSFWLIWTLRANDNFFFVSRFVQSLTYRFACIRSRFLNLACCMEVELEQESGSGILWFNDVHICSLRLTFLQFFFERAVCCLHSTELHNGPGYCDFMVEDSCYPISRHRQRKSISKYPPRPVASSPDLCDASFLHLNTFIRLWSVYRC